jgi:hypothetical protein
MSRLMAPIVRVAEAGKSARKMTTSRSEMRATGNDGQARTDVREGKGISGATMRERPVTRQGRGADQSDRKGAKIPWQRTVPSINEQER